MTLTLKKIYKVYKAKNVWFEYNVGIIMQGNKQRNKKQVISLFYI